MAVYVQSCGVSQDQDYRWLKIGENYQIPEIPSILRESFPSRVAGTTVQVTDLIDSKTPSIILARLRNQLLLLVTGLKAKEERIDFMGRPIRNSVAWVYPYSEENEQIIRSLTICALKGDLEAEIDEAVYANSEYGFAVSYEAITQLKAPESVGFSEAEYLPKIGKNLDKLREDLALELEGHCLPQKDGLLVVITGIKTKDALFQANIWRGLSNRVDEEEWIQYSEPWAEQTPTRSESRQHQSGESNFFLLIAVAVGLVLIVILAIFIKFLHPLITEPKSSPASIERHQMNPVAKMRPQQQAFLSTRQS